MRYYTERPKNALCTRTYNYECDHPLYSECSLIKRGDNGLAIVQERYNAKLKIFWYGPLESWLVEEIMNASRFDSYFEKNSRTEKNGLYPTVTVRKLMWALKMKPLRKDRWDSQKIQCLL